MSIYALLITEEWENNHNKLYASYEGNKTEEFEIFKQAYSQHYHELESVKIQELTEKLSKFGIKNDRIVKIFNYIYVWKGLDDTDTCRKYITGFCDVTGCLQDIKTVYERDYCIDALKQFMRYGGIVRIKDKDLVYDEYDELVKLVTENTPNIVS